MTLLERDREKFEEGKREAKLEENIEIIRNFIKVGASFDMVITATGLDEETVKKLFNEVENNNH